MDKKEINELVTSFLAIRTLRELAICLKTEYKILTYYLYRLKDEDKYKEFDIKKRNGNVRRIIAPIPGLKFIQSNLNIILQNIFPPKNGIHGFTLNKSIKSNAIPHINKKILLNLDLKDFFPTINFGRVRGLFLAGPFNFPTEIATALAQISCYKNTLPQGAPSSPIISNFICRRLDNEIIRLVAQNRAVYTRYADDITISTNLKNIPDDIGSIVDHKLVLSSKFNQIIQNNGFEINEIKSRYALKNNRQEVTGLIVNKKVNVNRKYIRHIRAILHSWEKFGITRTANEHFSKFNVKNKSIINPETALLNELVGKIGFIGFIKEKDNNIYKILLKRLLKLAPEVRLNIIQSEIEKESNPVVFGEGKTDWRHLKKAFDVFKSLGYYREIFLRFHEYDDHAEINNDQLLDICKSIPKTNFSKTKVICIFDRDDRDFKNKITQNGNLYKNWGKGVYSLLMPIPSHREFEEICIEHYYSDADLKIVDTNGRRIFLSNEFNADGTHLKEELHYKNVNKLRVKYPRILDYDVLNKESKNVALSKMDFSKYILDEITPYNRVSFEYFKAIFDEIEKIVKLPND